MYRHIVVPLDGSEFSRTAIPYALALASGTEAEVELVSSVEVVATLTGAGFTGDISGGIPGYGTGTEIPPAGELLEASRRNREEHLRRTAEAIRPETVRWTVLDGSPAEAVAEHVEATGADLVVLSTHGRGGLQRAWLGSVADRLVRSLPVPAFLVRPAEDEVGLEVEPSIGRILITLDGSPLAEAVLEPARRVASRLGAAVLLLRVVESDLSLGSPYLPEVARQQEEHYEAMAETSEVYLDDVAQRLTADGIEVAGRLVRTGAPTVAISQVAEEEADMVAMATHGRGGLRRWFLGSVSDKVLRQGTLPMLLVRPEDQGAHGGSE